MATLSVYRVFLQNIMSTEQLRLCKKKNYGHPFGLLGVFAKCNEYRTVRAVQKSLPMAPFRFIKCFCPNVASTECSGTVKFVQKSRPLALLVVYQVGGAGRWQPKSSHAISSICLTS